ncbi:hypothetical protein DPMN_065967 [Dreissena polymorpha]|uniref:Uncharacterized protein n=1 Tax=Dreissena polymorpha TaxID=45954 RepID=A0A9D4BSG7_DREPO|nr:hypothetical protein DPMN_065967 [Dreissena polymorpha]
MATDIRNLCDERRELRHEKYTSLESRADYQKAIMELEGRRKHTIEAKEEWIK